MAPADRPGDAFRRALDEILRRPVPGTDKGGPHIHGPGPGARLDLGPAQGGGGEARWSFAMAWADEPLTPGAQTARIIRSEPGLAPATASLAEMVARELGFRPDLSVQQLTDRWRAYVWRNHPDRQPALARDEANARVAVANALYDSARHAFGRI